MNRVELAGGGTAMTDCTERHTAALDCGLAGEGQEGMAKVAQP
jgi:hypothetical protein